VFSKKLSATAKPENDVMFSAKKAFTNLFLPFFLLFLIFFLQICHGKSRLS
jgi:hypothetical protein